MKLCCLVLAFLPVLAVAQNPGPLATPAPDGNYLQNGNFEKFATKDNLWDGVDNEGCLSGFPGNSEVIQEGGGVGGMPMAISVQVADVNGDGLLDLVTADVHGYFRVYFNRGTKTAPKFDHAEFIPLCLRRIPGALDGLFSTPKISLAELETNGPMSMVVGNYLGQLLILKNTGTRTVPEWRQPAKIDGVRIPTTTDGRLWANLFAPAAFDWNHDGKIDIIVGEGSYSANSVHLLLNEGSNTAPKFNDDSRTYLAYGDGREQLVPAVVDYNGDGNPDLLVGDRTGNINVYLSDGPWKKGSDVQLKRLDAPISFGGATTVIYGSPGAKCVAPTVADLNGDGLFDIIVGEPNERIAVAYNIGTATEPKFGPLQEIKGEDVWKMGTIRTPIQWELFFGEWDGNFYGSTTVVTPEDDPQAAPTNSKHVLRVGYFPSLNQTIRKPSTPFPSTGKITDYTGIEANFSIYPKLHSGMGYLPIDQVGWQVDSNVLILRQRIEVGLLKPNTNYKLTFKVKGHGVKDAGVRVSLGGWLIKSAVTDPSEVPAKSNGNGTESKNLLSSVVFQQSDFAVAPNWTPVTKQYNFKFDKQDLNSPDKWIKSGRTPEYRGLVEFRAAVAPDSGVLYIDDVQLVPQP